MGRTPTTDSHHLQIKESGSSYQIENPSIAISESLSDPRLPQDLITDILLRLPVKSLTKSKCVSKSWLSLISSRQFIMSHLSRSSNEGDYLNHQLLFTYHRPAPAAMKQCSLYFALHEVEPSRYVSEIEYPFQIPNYPPLIVGIVNGLFCLAINYATYLLLWNPALRKSKHLPSSIVILKPFKPDNYGFGYDESNDDYKVVCFVRVYSEVVFEYEVYVYSLRADSWRRIEDLKGFRLSYDPGMYTNGKIFWSAFKRGASTPNRTIVSLDMVSDKYGELQQPPYEAGYNKWKFGVLGGRPFVLCEYITKVDLWVMDKYGVEESWCKVVSIENDDFHPLKPYFHQQILCILSNDEILLENGFRLLVYHSKHKKNRIIEMDVRSSSYFKVASYVESLVWPSG